jgi:Methyltransferase domain
MSSWLLKTALQHVFGALPRREWWNGLMQRYVTRGLCLEAYGEFQAKVRAGQRHFRNYYEFSTQPRENFVVVEVGTGWFPIIPIALHLCGAGQIWTYDIVSLIRTDTFHKVVEHFCSFATTGELYEVLPDALRDRVSDFITLARSPLPPIEFLRRLNINPAIGKVCNLPLKRGSVDFVFSHGVLEHFTPPLLAKAAIEFRRVCHGSSAMSHFVGMADQFSFSDKSITPFNNMRYSTRVWKWLDSPIIPQNRLRTPDYIGVLTSAGFEVLAREDIIGEERALARVKLAPEFRHYTQGDLRVLYSWLVSRPLADNSLSDSISPKDPGFGHACKRPKSQNVSAALWMKRVR